MNTIITAGWRKRFTTSHFICKCTVHALFPSDCRGLRDRSIVLYYHIRNRSYRQSGYHNHRTGKSGNRKFSGYCPLCVGKLSESGNRICHIHTILFEKEFDPVRWRTADFGAVIPSAVLFRHTYWPYMPEVPRSCCIPWFLSVVPACCRC